MSRRRSITLHDIVRMNPVAKEHYAQIRGSSQAMDICGEEKPSTASFVHPEVGGINIEYDPLLLAESLVILEEEEGEQDDLDPGIDRLGKLAESKDDAPLLPKAVPLSTRRVSIGGAGTKIVTLSDSSVRSVRKKSAIDEHERIVAELEKMGFMVL